MCARRHASSRANASVSDASANRGIGLAPSLCGSRPCLCTDASPQRPLSLDHQHGYGCVGFGVTVSTFTPVSGCEAMQQPWDTTTSMPADSSRDCHDRIDEIMSKRVALQESARPHSRADGAPSTTPTKMRGVNAPSRCWRGGKRFQRLGIGRVTIMLFEQRESGEIAVLKSQVESMMHPFRHATISADGTYCVWLKTRAVRTIESTSQFFRSVAHNPVGVGQLQVFLLQGPPDGCQKKKMACFYVNFSGVCSWRAGLRGCWQHRNVLRACPGSLVCPAPCPGASTPWQPRECIGDALNRVMQASHPPMAL